LSLSALYPANKTPVEIKPSTITKIQVSPEKLEALRRLLESPKMTPFAKEYRQRRVVGTCAGCGGMPEFIVTKYYEGLQKIEKYCDKCLEQRENRTIGNEEIKSKVQVVESVSAFTHSHPKPSDQ
jgi:hypothetical protein